MIGIAETEAEVALAGAVELKNAVSSKFGIELPATVTFDYPSTVALATFVASRMARMQVLLS